MQKYTKPLLTVFWLVVLVVICAFFFIPPWQTYTNEKYGFQIKFPREVQVIFEQDKFYAAFHIKDSARDINYLLLRIYKKPHNYKDPVGPFPIIESNEKMGKETSPGYLNGIPGFRESGGVEGGGGLFEGFFFIRGENLWEIGWTPLSQYVFDPKYANTMEGRIQEKIINSFRLIE